MFTLALIAHDGRKAEMVTLLNGYRECLECVSLVATLHTGVALQVGTGLPVTCMQSGSLGGDQEIGTLVANGIVKAVIFLRDPLTVKPNEPDITALLRICDVRQIPLATNLATAAALLHTIMENPASLLKTPLGVTRGTGADFVKCPPIR